MNPQEILDSCIIEDKHRKLPGGYEPASNTYFDFYASSRYVVRPLIDLEDIALHLFLRKNFNPTNPQWKMPTIRQMKERFRIGPNRILSIIDRLGAAHLLKKYSGAAEGWKTTNDYRLSDPIQTLPQFLVVAEAGLFPYPLRDEWINRVAEVAPCYRNGNTGVTETETRGVSETETDQQTSKTEHTGMDVWDLVLDFLRPSMPYDTFARLLSGSKLLCIDNGKAVIEIPNSGSIAWLESRMSRTVSRVLGLELREKIEAVEFVALENDGAESVGYAKIPKVLPSLLSTLPD